jgi:hypothetical protein
MKKEKKEMLQPKKMILRLNQHFQHVMDPMDLKE